MNHPNPYGPSCPFCGTLVSDHLTVCTGCGAEKGLRSSTLLPIQSLFRMMFWLSTFGFIVLVTGLVVISPTPKGDSALLWLVFRIAALPIGFVCWKIASRIWVSIFGRLSDPLWVR